MLSSIAQPLAALASGAATAAQPLLTGVAAPAPKASASTPAATLKTVVTVADVLLDAAERAGVLPGPAAKASRSKASGAGYAQAATPSKSSSSKSTSKTTSSKSTSTSKSSSTSKSTATAKKAGPLDFLDDPKLSIEDKLMRLLAHLNDKWEKDLQKKMKELKQSQGGAEPSTGAPAAAPSSSSKSGGIAGVLGSVVKAATTFFPAAGVGLELLRNPAARAVISKLGGPVLAAAATATGFPELAPLALKYGPAIVDAAAGVASAAAGAGAAAASSSTSSGASTGTSYKSKPDGMGLSSDSDAKLKLMEIQRIYDQQKEMFALVSNILRSAHDGRMSVIQNVR
jgi:hypothetical protein